MPTAAAMAGGCVGFQNNQRCTNVGRTSGRPFRLRGISAQRSGLAQRVTEAPRAHVVVDDGVSGEDGLDTGRGHVEAQRVSSPPGRRKRSSKPPAATRSSRR